MEKLGKAIIGILLIAILYNIAIHPLANQYFAPDYIKQFTKEQALEDYDAMWSVLEENFPYFNVAERKFEIHKDEVKDKYRRKIEEDSALSFCDFYEIILSCLSEFKNIGHMGLFSPVAYEAIMNSFNETKNAPSFLTTILKNEKSVSTYRYLQNTYSFNQAKTNVNPSPKKNSEVKELNDNTAYIQIKSFVEPNRENDQQMLFDYYKSTSNKDNLIIDLRGNGGGSDYYWMENIVSPNIDQMMEYKGCALVMGGKDNVELFENHTGKTLNSDFSEISTLPNINQDDLKQMDFWFNYTYSIKPLNTEKIFKGNIYILTDKTVYSATEGFIMFCKQTGFAKLVGFNTRGDGGGGVSPIYKALPNSGLIFSYRITYALNPDGSSNVEYGTSPDYASGEGEDALDTCLRMIEESKK